MDLAYHALTGLVLSKALTGDYSAGAAIAAVLPDIIGASTYRYIKIAHTRRSSLRILFTDFFHLTKRDDFFDAADRRSYRAAHSWFILPAVFFFTLILFPSRSILFTLSYFSHLLIDIPTHSGEFSQRPFYPISDFHIEAVNWIQNGKVFILFWLILLGIYLIQLFSL